jgi:PAS domain S-box-containing protein
MQDQTKRIGVTIGFVILLVILTGNAFLLRHNLETQSQLQNWVPHTIRVELELAQIQSLLTDAETGQRGYLYTRDAQYLAPYTAARNQLASHLDTLQQLTVDNPVQQQRMPRLRELTSQKLNELQRTIDLAQSGQADAARTLVDSDAGMKIMNSLRSILGEMKDEEDRLDTERAQAYGEALRNTSASIILTAVIAASGLVLLLLSTLSHLQAREKHSQQLLEREQWFRITLTSLGDAVITTDREGNVTYLNPLAEDLIGIKLESARGKPVEDVFPIFNEATLRKVENPIVKVLETGRIVGLANHTVLRQARGSLIPIEDSAAPIRDRQDRITGVVLVFRDATNERKTQKLLRETERLTSAARMSASVAHEINNPLEAVTNLLYLAKGTPGVPQDAIQCLETAERELERIAHITKRTLGFYRESKVAELISLPNVIDSVLNLYSTKLANKSLSVMKKIDTCPSVLGIEGEMRQAVANLISNAIDAAPENGHIHILCHADTSENRVFLCIEDNGPGIPSEVAQRMFEPFFTTKKDVGTGLGLWITREIVERHNGSLKFHDSAGELGGAKFSMWLPYSNEKEQHS